MHDLAVGGAHRLHRPFLTGLLDLGRDRSGELGQRLAPAFPVSGDVDVNPCAVAAGVVLDDRAHDLLEGLDRDSTRADQRSDLWFTYHLGRMIRERSIGAKGKRIAHGTYTLSDLPGGGTHIEFEFALQKVPAMERPLLPLMRKMVRKGNESVIAFYRQLGYAEDEVVVLGKRLIPDL